MTADQRNSCRTEFTCGSEEAMAHEAAAAVIATACDAVKEKGSFSLALSGGSSPRPLFRQIALGVEKKLFARYAAPSTFRDAAIPETGTVRMPWENTALFWSDERCVPAMDGRSNYRMAKESLLRAGGPAERNIHRMPAGDLPPNEAARAYESTLREYFSEENGNLAGGYPVFDLVMLGMGGDGHTASLFPNDTLAPSETPVWVAAVVPPLQANPPVPRLTLTLPVINHACSVLFFISGTEKASIAENIVSGKEKNLPASLVMPRKGIVRWFCVQP
ncbi:MAG: 6-phosphogluconolactonase [Chlorobiaceae bacterium]|nr:6-phosphogluconolactonase [Chlorobiaceae bacterium]